MATALHSGLLHGGAGTEHGGSSPRLRTFGGEPIHKAAKPMFKAVPWLCNRGSQRTAAVLVVA